MGKRGPKAGQTPLQMILDKDEIREADFTEAEWKRIWRELGTMTRNGRGPLRVICKDE